MTTEGTGLHPVNIGHLVMGLAFAGLLAIWALIVGDVVDTDHVGPLLGLPWVLAGGIGLLAAFLAGRQRRHTNDTTTTTTTNHDDYSEGLR